MDKDTRTALHSIMNGRTVGGTDRDDIEALMSDNEKFWAAVRLVLTAPCDESGVMLAKTIEDIVEAEVIIAKQKQSRTDSEQPDDEGHYSCLDYHYNLG